MANSWTRAWLATLAVMIGAAALVRNRHDTITDVEDQVLDWLLDGTDTGFWDRFEWLGASWFVWTVAIVGAVLLLLFDRLLAAVLPLTVVGAEIAARLVRGAVERPRPEDSTALTSSYPSIEVVHAGVALGLIALVLWWFGLPRLLWQVVVEITVVLMLAVAIDQIADAQHWPSDTIGSAIVVAFALVSAAIVLERRPRRKGLIDFRRSSDNEPVPEAA
ncbi:MAG: phosphatase PAP2 family protein [Acidimicrobiales bacterium]